MYSVSNLKKINNIKIGDKLVYGINCHYSWEIIDIDKNSIMISTGLWSYDSDRNYKVYVYPLFHHQVNNTDACYVTSKNYGDICDNHTVNGIDRLYLSLVGKDCILFNSRDSFRNTYW